MALNYDILRNYPYLQDGQFVLEDIQQYLIEDYVKKVQHSAGDFVVIDAEKIVHASMLPWDTNHFGRCMARLQHFYFQAGVDMTDAYDALDQWMKTNNVEHISTRLNLQNRTAINFLIRQGYEVMVGKVMLRCNNSRLADIPDRPEFSVYRTYEKGDLPKLIEISAGSFKDNRFVIDQYLNPQLAEQLYRKWVENECTNGSSDRWVLKYEDKIAGFCLTQTIVVNKVKVGFVNLIASDHTSQRSGIAKYLLHQVLSSFKAEAIYSVYANVVATNNPSLSLFQAGGFRMFATLLELRKYYGNVTSR